MCISDMDFKSEKPEKTMIFFKGNLLSKERLVIILIVEGYSV